MRHGLNRKKIIAQNGMVGLGSQLLTQVFNFLLRKCILKYVGVETLGLSATLTSIISALSLVELGFQQAVVFYLYKPLHEADMQMINRILVILKKVYRAIGIFLVFAALIMSIFLERILKGVAIGGIVYLYYFVICLNTVMTYFLAYRRAMLYADQKEYIAQGIDSIINIFSFFLKYVAICYVKSFALYLVIQVMQTIIANVFVTRYCQKQYPYLGTVEFDRSIFSRIFKDVKNVFWGKIAGFVYGATDNLVISVILGTVQVGYLSNYVIFNTAIKQTVNAMFHSMTSIIGNWLSEKKDSGQEETNFRIYAYFRYLLASIIVVPWMLLSDNLVQLFFGADYILGKWISILVGADLYIHIVYSLCCEYINGSGKFLFDRNVSVIGALINIISSVALANWLGIAGVLTGTVISQIFFWGARSVCVYTKVFFLKRRKYIIYVMENVKWILGIIAVIGVSRFFDGLFAPTNLLIGTIRTFFICEVINIVMQIFILLLSDKRRMVLQLINNRKGKKDDCC